MKDASMRPNESCASRARAFVGALVVAGAALLALPARGDEHSQHAKLLYDEATKKYDIGQYDQAVVDFKSAYLAKPDPAFLFNVGQCYRRMGKPQEAAEAYRAYLRKKPAAPNRADVEGFIRDAEQEIEKRRKEPAGTAEPDKSLVQPTASPAPTATENAVTAPRRTEPAPAGPSPPVYRRWWFWTTIGAVVLVGAAAGIAGAYATPNDAPIPAGAMPVRF